VPRHTSAAFVEFLGDIVTTQPRQREIHVIVDNLSTHACREQPILIHTNPEAGAMNASRPNL
jgi:hypothetical protein